MSNPDTVRKFMFDVGWVFISSIFSIAIGFLLRIILGNYFGPEGLGNYSMILTIYLMASFFSGIGIKASLIKYVSEYKGKKEQSYEIVSSGIITTVGCGMVATIIIYVFSDLFADLFAMPKLSNSLKIIAFIFPFLLMNEGLLGVINGQRRMKLFAIGTIIRRSVVIVFTFGFILLGWGLNGAVFALVISAIITSLFLIVVMKEFFHHITLRNYRDKTKKLVSFGSKMFLTNAIGTISHNIDKLMIGYFLIDKDLGIYSVALMFATFLLIIPQSIQQITFPAISEYYAKGARDSIEKIINLCMKYSFVLLGLFGMLMIFLSQDIISFMYPSKPVFLDALPIIIILVSGLICYGSVLSIGASFSSIGRPEISLKISILAMSINVVLNYVLIQRFGLVGTAFATIISRLVGNIIFTYLFKPILNIKISKGWFLKGIGIIVISTSVFYFLRDYINHYLAIFTWIMLFLFGMILSKMIKLNEIHTFKKSIFKKY